MTAREREVLDLVATGMTTRAIADRLAIGVATVEAHVRNVRHKVGVRTRWQAASAVTDGTVGSLVVMVGTDQG